MASLPLTFLAGMYAGIGLVGTAWYYLNAAPVWKDDSVILVTLQSLIFGVLWFPIIGAAVLSLAVE